MPTNSRDDELVHPAEAAAAADRYHVPNLSRALMLLEHLASMQRPQGISEIAEALGLPKNSVFRIANTLHAYGYLQRDEATKCFSLSTKFLSLGYAALGESGLVHNALDVMHEMRDQTDETTLVGIIDGSEGVVLEQVLSNQQVRVMIGVGTRFPLHTAAPAKAYMAHLPVAQRDALLDRLTLTRFTDHTLTDRAALLDEIERARVDGYAIDNGEHNDGIRCIGAAVLNHRAAPIGAVWVVGPAFRLTPADFPRLGPLIAAGARRISQRFGHNPIASLRD
ncbi:MAG: helix-turn-helix domain-containing protein [Planctomycetes bacterium]|nr:helix-turn-helix domain-containing protein [Planctomycetota bacterium]